MLTVNEQGGRYMTAFIANWAPSVVNLFKLVARFLI
jgi:hypothetical protein